MTTRAAWRGPVVLALIVGLFAGGQVSAGGLHSLSPSELKEVQDMQRDLRVVLWRWERGGYINDAFWTVKIQNRGRVPYRDIRYSVVYLVPSGTRFEGGKDGAIAGPLLPGKVATVEINTGAFPRAMFGSHPAARAEYKKGSGTVYFELANKQLDRERLCMVVIGSAKR